MTRSKKKFGEQQQQLAAMSAVADAFKGFRPSGKVLTKVQAVPTIFPQYDRITRVGGHPIARIALVHGPSNEGKTVFTTGLGLSFLRRNHFYGLIDAERSTPVEWLDELMGEYRNHPGFVALPATTYEGAVDAVREFCDKIADARRKGALAPETTGLVVVDSLRKLVPNKMMKLLEQGAAKNGVDGIGGRAGQIKAALNAAWMDELVPLMHETNCAIALISRETEDPNAGFYDEGIKIGGGKAVFYDSSIAVRITRAFIPHPVEEQAKRGGTVGERHMIEIRKTRVGKKETKKPRGYFHTSNGALGVPAGYDLARDILELGKACGVIDLNGSWYSYDGRKLGNGEEATLRGMRGDVELFGAIERDVRAVACAVTEKKEDDDAGEERDDGKDVEPRELQQRASRGDDRAGGGRRRESGAPAGKAAGHARTRSGKRA